MITSTNYNVQVSLDDDMVSFVASVKTDGIDDFQFSLGSSRETDCVRISFQKKGYGNLDNLYYDIKCRENGDLVRGTGTLLMVHCAIYCVCMLYPIK